MFVQKNNGSVENDRHMKAAFLPDINCAKEKKSSEQNTSDCFLFDEFIETIFDITSAKEVLVKHVTKT